MNTNMTGYLLLAVTSGQDHDCLCIAFKLIHSLGIRLLPVVESLYNDTKVLLDAIKIISLRI